MVILYGHMSRCDRIPRQIALEDVWMALDMLPSFRWRWERKDVKQPGHPLIAKLAEKVLDVNLHQVAPTGAPMLLSEQDWDGENIRSPKPGAVPQPPTPKVAPTPGPGGPYGAPPNGAGAVKGSPGAHNGDVKGGQPTMPELPPYYFYPIYSENGTQAAAAGAMPNVNYNYQSDHYVLEEKEMPPHWPNGVSARDPVLWWRPVLTTHIRRHRTSGPPQPSSLGRRPRRLRRERRAGLRRGRRSPL